jgi:hypothetical protein
MLILLLGICTMLKWAVLLKAGTKKINENKSIHAASILKVKVHFNSGNEGSMFLRNVNSARF